MKRTPLTALLACWSLWSCASTVTPGSSSAGASSASSATSDGGGGTGARSSHCPESPPDDRSPCVHVSVEERPDLPDGVGLDSNTCRWRCKASAYCGDGGWRVVQAGGCAQQPAECPATPPEPATDCSDPSMGACRYDDGTTTCGCFDCGPYAAPCPDHTGTRWACAKLAPGCPHPPANPGEPCETEGLFCSYGAAPCYSSEQVCMHGEWYATTHVCPM